MLCLHDEFPDEEAILFPLNKRLFVRVIRGRHEEVVDLILAVGQTHLRLVLDDVVNLDEFADAIEDVVGARELRPLANFVGPPGSVAALIVKPSQTSAFIHR